MGWLALKKSDIDGGWKTWEGDDNVKVGGSFGEEVREVMETVKKMNVNITSRVSRYSQILPSVN